MQPRCLRTVIVTENLVETVRPNSRTYHLGCETQDAGRRTQDGSYSTKFHSYRENCRIQDEYYS